MRISGRCPFCGNDGDSMMMDDYQELRGKLTELKNNVYMLEKTNQLQEGVIKEQIRAIYDYVKSKKISPS